MYNNFITIKVSTQLVHVYYDIIVINPFSVQYCTCTCR